MGLGLVRVRVRVRARASRYLGVRVEEHDAQRDQVEELFDGAPG